VYDNRILITVDDVSNVSNVSGLSNSMNDTYPSRGTCTLTRANTLTTIRTYVSPLRYVKPVHISNLSISTICPRTYTIIMMTMMVMMVMMVMMMMMMMMMMIRAMMIDLYDQMLVLLYQPKGFLGH